MGIDQFWRTRVDLRRLVGRNVVIVLVDKSCGVCCTISSILAIDGIELKELEENINLR